MSSHSCHVASCYRKWGLSGSWTRGREGTVCRVDVGWFLSVPHCFCLGNAPPPPCMWPGGLSVKQGSATSGQLINGNMMQVGPIKILLTGLRGALGERVSLRLSSCTLVNTMEPAVAWCHLRCYRQELV